MKKTLIILIFSSLMASCESVGTITIANRQLYYGQEAVIANDFYDKLYKEEVIKEKPIMLKVK